MGNIDYDLKIHKLKYKLAKLKKRKYFQIGAKPFKNKSKKN